MSGYVYHIIDVRNSTDPINRWVPFNPKFEHTKLAATLRTQVLFAASDKALDVQVYPNPAADVVELQYETVVPGDVTIKLLDTQGVVRKQAVKEDVGAGAQQDQLLINDLPMGVYELQVTTPTGVLHETIFHP
ncbi:MAG: T9SS type A sorting domain-containing protein [Hymenobacteraceae bacterium]|nr:T9SS type A sorting domain-containing protein [Hymenobacteraceae bacterium]